jgi:Cys-tRNA(Pro) deacylase
MAAEKDKFPVTQAVRALKAAGITYEGFLYDYVERGGTTTIAKALNLDEHIVIKTLVMETDAKKPLVILMHGDRSVSVKNLARILGVKSISPCEPAQAERNSGYKCGGTSPFGLKRRDMPIYVEKTILDLEYFYINGGHRGFCVRITPADLQRALTVTPVEVAIDSLD